MKTHKSRLFLINVIIIIVSCTVVIACMGKGQQPTINSKEPAITLITNTMLDDDSQKCYNGKSYIFDIAAVNNNGVVSGSILTASNGKCRQRGYLWNSALNQFSVIPLLEIDGFATIATRISVLSSNLISGGITFTESRQSLEFATFNINLSPKDSIWKWNYVFGISEQGRYIVGTTFAGSYLFFDISSNKQIKLTYKGTPISGTFPMELSRVSNNGIAVGSISERKDNTDTVIGVVCQVTDKVCYSIDNILNEKYVFLRSISSNGKIIYGFINNPALGTIKVISVNPLTKSATDIIDSFYIADTVVTDDGLIILTNNINRLPFIYDPNIKSLYSMQDLIKKLMLPKGIQLYNISLSPNGKYLAFNMANFDNGILGIKIYFPLGIADYLKNNLLPVSYYTGIHK